MAMKQLNLAEESVGDLLWQQFEAWSEGDAGLDTAGQFVVNKRVKSQSEKIAYSSVDCCSQSSTQPPRVPRVRRLVYGLTVTTCSENTARRRTCRVKYLQRVNLLSLTVVTEREGGSVQRETVSEEEPTGGAVLVYVERVAVDMGLEDGVESMLMRRGMVLLSEQMLQTEVEQTRGVFSWYKSRERGEETGMEGLTSRFAVCRRGCLDLSNHISVGEGRSVKEMTLGCCVS